MDISTRSSYVEESVERALDTVLSFADKCHALVQHLPVHRRLIEPVVTPRFVPTCSDGLLMGLSQISESKSLRIQSHLAEAHDQVQWVREDRGLEDIQVFDRVRNLAFFNLASKIHCINRTAS
jgi:guanine deaminase